MATSKLKIFMELDIISITNVTNAINLCYIDIYKYSKSSNDWSIQIIFLILQLENCKIYIQSTKIIAIKFLFNTLLPLKVNVPCPLLFFTYSVFL
jgi:hypothetical protein